MDARALLLVLFLSAFLGHCEAQRNSNVCHGRSIDLCMSSLVSKVMQSIALLHQGTWVPMLKRRMTKCSFSHLLSLSPSLLLQVLFAQGPGSGAGGEADLDRQCSYLKEADGCFRNYTRQCTTSTQRQMFNILLDGGRQLYRSFCRPDSPARTSYLQHAPCLQRVSKDQRSCFRDLQAAFEVVTSAPSSKRLQLTCCGYRRLRRCTSDIVSKECGRDTLDFSNQLTASMTSRLPDIVCQEFRPRSPKCKELPPPGTPPSEGRPASVLNRLLAAYINT